VDAPLATKVGFDGWHSVLEWNQLCGPEDGLTDREKRLPTPFILTRRDGKRLVTDGPFAETHEQLGGYFLIEVKNLDEALVVAHKIPMAGKGTIEVRPVIEFP